MSAFGEVTNVSNSCVSLVPIFQALEPNEMMEIVKLGNSRKYKKGEFIFQSGDSEDHLYIVHKGKVKVSRLTDSGNEQLIRILDSGDFMGEFSLFSESEHDSYAEALKETEMCVIRRSDFQNILIKYPSISLKVVQELGTRLKRAEKLVSQIVTQNVEIRVASYLVQLGKQEETTNLVLPISKKQLASYLGTSQETLSRKLSVMQKKEWIKLKGQRDIQIIDLPTLQRIAGESEC